jgi:hypothetical protein
LGAFDSFQRLLDRDRTEVVSSSAASSFVDASESAGSEVWPSSDASVGASAGAAESVDFASPEVSVDDPVDDDCVPEVSAGSADATP